MPKMIPKLIDLPWLAVAPNDWLQQCRDLSPEYANAGERLKSLASFRLDASQSNALRRTLNRLTRSGSQLSPLKDFRLGVLAAETFDLVLDCLPAAALRHGLSLRTTSMPYGQIMQPLLDPGSALYTSELDAVLLVADHRWLGLEKISLVQEDDAILAQALLQVEQLLRLLRKNGGLPAILQTLALPQSGVFGSYDARVSGTLRARVERFNTALVSLSNNYGAYLVDVAALASQVGSDQWFNPVQWAAYKIPFDTRAAPVYAEWVSRLLGAIRGTAAKCLVLDLDNTLWGGVIGDDGIQGIAVGQGNPRGEAHLALQAAALDLKKRGIFLAVASKNEDIIAREPFRNLPDMLIREHDISVFQANWVDKASNLEAIASMLNIGLDALVFVDDNPAEREQVRNAIPSVRVLEMPDDPAYYAWMLRACGWFEAVTFSPEDADRIEMQAADSFRAEVMQGTRDLSHYLQELGMVASFAPFNPEGRQRITQLVNKTNQFNLTTKRYTENQIRAFEAGDATLALQVRLADKFGDLGMIAVVICTPVEHLESAWKIDSWLMSCRVLGREVEKATLSVIVGAARQKGICRLIGHYIPTDKNMMVADHYEKLGFNRIESDMTDHTVWELDLESYQSPALPMRVIGKLTEADECQ